MSLSASSSSTSGELLSRLNCIGTLRIASQLHKTRLALCKNAPVALLHEIRLPTACGNRLFYDSCRCLSYGIAQICLPSLLCTVLS